MRSAAHTRVHHQRAHHAIAACAPPAAAAVRGAAWRRARRSVTAAAATAPGSKPAISAEQVTFRRATEADMDFCRSMVLQERCVVRRAAAIMGRRMRRTPRRLHARLQPAASTPTRLAPAQDSKLLPPPRAWPCTSHPIRMNPLGISQERMLVAAAPDGRLLGMGQLVPLSGGASELRSIVVAPEAR